MIAILAPLEIEIKRLRAMLEIDSTVYYHPGRIWHGRLGGHEVCLARVGMGKQPMQRATAHCLRLFRPSLMILLGFGGAADPALDIGDLVICQKIIDAASHEAWITDPGILAQASKAAERAGVPARLGTAVTSSTIVTSPHDKAFLGAQHGATIVEMEGSSFAATAAAAGVPWLMIRAVADQMATALPEGLSCEEDGTLSLISVVRFLCQHPRIIGQLSGLHIASLKARDAVTKFTQAWLAG